MNNIKVFDTVCNETTRDCHGYFSYTISAICDENGSFAINVVGNGGADMANEAAKRIMELIRK